MILNRATLDVAQTTAYGPGSRACLGARTKSTAQAPRHPHRLEPPTYRDTADSPQQAITKAGTRLDPDHEQRLAAEAEADFQPLPRSELTKIFQPTDNYRPPAQSRPA